MSGMWFYELSDGLHIAPAVLKRIIEAVLLVFIVVALRHLVLRIMRRHAGGAESAASRRFANTGTLFVVLLLLLWQVLREEWTIGIAAWLGIDRDTVIELLYVAVIVVLMFMVRHVALGVISQRVRDERNALQAKGIVNTITLCLAVVFCLWEVIAGDWKDEIAAVVRLQPKTVEQLLHTATAVVVLLVARHLALSVIAHRVEDVRRSFHARRVVNYALGFLAILLVAWEWILGSTNIGTFLGLLSAGIAIALSDLLANFAGWMFISIRRPFVVGDRIQIGDHIGDVVDIRLFQSFLLECGNWVDADQSTGRIVMVPNGLVFKQSTSNYTRGFEYLWDELYVLVTFESDWRRMKELMVQIANEHAQPLSQGAQAQLRRAASKHMIFFRNLTPIVYTTVKDSGVQLAIRYLTPVRQRRASAERLWEAILDALAKEPSIDLAYPTVRRFSNVIEGKPEARAPMPPQL